MTTPTDWHVPATSLARYAHDSGGLDAATAGSIEAHLVACDRCRADLSAVADPGLAATSWESIADRIDRPRPSPLEWLLLHLGVRSGPARLAAATPGLRLSGLGAVAALTALAAGAADLAGASGPFLLVAPLVPLVAVALTFAWAPDPAGETGIATPMHGAGLVLRRALAVLSLVFVVLLLGALFVPDSGEALVWVVPSAALALGSLALGTWVRLELAIVGVATTWVVGLSASWSVRGGAHAYLDSAVFSTAGQWVGLAVCVLAAATLLVRADRYSTMEARA